MSESKKNNIIVFDLETQKTFDEVGGHHNSKDLKVSLLGAYSYSQQKFFTFTEQQLSVFEKILLAERPMLIGFNSIHFDNAVLQPYFQNLDLATLPHLDLLVEVTKALKTRLKLETVAQGTLREGKSGSGLDAIQYFKQGDLKSLAKYCLDDVRITRDLYEYGKRHGFLLYTNYGEYRRIPISYSEGETIEQMLTRALVDHQTVEVTVIRPQAEKTVRETVELEIRRLEGDLLTAFLPKIGREEVLDIRCIFHAHLTGRTYAHQASLL